MRLIKSEPNRSAGYTFEISKQRAKGRIKVMVVNPITGKIEQETHWCKNLLLTSGIDKLATMRWMDLNTYMVYGDGADPTTDDSGAITASQTGTTVTLSSGLAAVAANRLIRWDTGVEAKIVSGSGTSWTVSPSQEVSAGQFTVYRIEQTALTNELGRTASYLTGAGNTESTIIGGVITNRTTYNSATFGADKNIAEIGFSDLAAAGANLTYRILLAGGAITVATGKVLRVVHDQIITVSPITNSAIVPTATGWPVMRACTMDISTDYVTLAGHGYVNGNKVIFRTSGTLPTGLTAGTTYYVRDKTTDTFKVEATVGGGAIDLSGANGSGHTAEQPLDAVHCLQQLGMAYFDTSRATLNYNTCLEPCGLATAAVNFIGVATDATALSAWNNNTYARAGEVSKALTQEAYVAGSGIRVAYATFSVSEANSAVLRQIFIRGNAYTNRVGWALLFTFNQIKADTATLKIRLQNTWNRDLSA